MAILDIYCFPRFNGFKSICLEISKYLEIKQNI